jgi:signal transduction histidine kinase
LFCEITTSAIRDSEEKLRLLFDTIPQLDTHTLELARDVIERQVHNLVRLVDDLLDVSRVMRGKIELKRESLELAEVVSRAVETAQPLINAQEHHLGVRVPAESLRIDVCRVPRNVAKLQRQSSSFRRSAFSKKCLSVKLWIKTIPLLVRQLHSLPIQKAFERPQHGKKVLFKQSHWRVQDFRRRQQLP